MASVSGALGATSSGILLNLLSAGIQRSGSLLIQKVVRLRKVEKAIKDLHAGNPAFGVALQDFTTVLGTYQGRYTTSVAAFLEELQKTGVIDAVAELAILDRDSVEVRAAFLDQFVRFVPPGEEDGGRLYEALFAAFRTTFAELSKDRIIYHALVSGHKEIDERLQRIEGVLRLSGGSSAGSHSADFESTIIKIARGLQQSYKHIRIETNRGPRKVEINRIYVPSKLSARPSIKHNKRLGVFMRSIQREKGEQRSVQDLLSVDRVPGSNADHALTTFTHLELQAGFKRTIVLGDPGGGKSTLCQKLCFDLSKNVVLSSQFPDDARLSPKNQRLPIRVILRNFEAAWVKDPQLDLLSYIERDLSHFVAIEKAELQTALRYLLASGRAILAFDGLDEILDTSKRQELVDRVTAFCDSYPLCAVLVTSRLVGYDDAPMPDEFDELVLQKFDDDEVVEYVSKFMRVVADQTAANSKALAHKFQEQTANTAQDLRRNPLMLGLMAWLFMASGDVPSNRPEIYRECSVLMFERWDQRRGIMADENTDFDRSQLFVELAADIYGNATLTGGVTRAWLEGALQQHFRAIYESRATAFRATKKFVEFITGRAWVMTEVGEDAYAFTHQTFLEYFFAIHLNDHHDSVNTLLRNLRRRIVRSEWNEVAHLALQIKTFRSLKKQEEALAILSSLIRAAKIPRQQAALVEFTARALNYLSPSEHSLRLFIGSTYGVAFDRALRGDFSALAGLTRMAKASTDRGAFIRERIADHLSQQLKSGGEKEKASLAPFILGIGSAAEHTRARSLDIDEGVADRVYSASRSEIIRRADSGPVSAGLAWGMFGHISPAAVATYGLAPLYNYPFRAGIAGIDGLFVLVLRASLWRSSRVRGVEVGVAEQGLLKVGEILFSGRKFVRSDFNYRSFSDPVGFHVWEEIMKSLAGSPKTALAALVVQSFCASLYRRRIQAAARESSRMSLRWATAKIPATAFLRRLRLPAEDIMRAEPFLTGEHEFFEERSFGSAAG